MLFSSSVSTKAYSERARENSLNNSVTFLLLSFEKECKKIVALGVGGTRGADLSPSGRGVRIGLDVAATEIRLTKSLDGAPAPWRGRNLRYLTGTVFACIIKTKDTLPTVASN